MLRIANILVPVDSADSALSQALFWAHRLQASVHAVETHVAGATPSRRLRPPVLLRPSTAASKPSRSAWICH